MVFGAPCLLSNEHLTGKQMANADVCHNVVVEDVLGGSIKFVAKVGRGEAAGRGLHRDRSRTGIDGVVLFCARFRNPPCTSMVKFLVGAKIEIDAFLSNIFVAKKIDEAERGCGWKGRTDRRSRSHPRSCGHCRWRSRIHHQRRGDQGTFASV